MSSDLTAIGLRYLLKYSDMKSPRVAAALAFEVFNTPVGARREQLKEPFLRQSRDVLARAEALDLSMKRLAVRLYRWRLSPPVAPVEPVRPGPRLRRVRTVLLTHGWTLGARYLTSFVDPLLAAGFEVAALDFPGHGASGNTRAPAPDSVRSIFAAAEVLGPVYAMLGHSFGSSMIALAAEGAPPLPEGLPVDRLVLLAPADRLSDTIARFAAEVEIGPETVALLEKKVEKMGRRPVASISISGALRHLGIPTLVVHDPADRVVPFSDAERLAAMPRVELYRAEGLGHMRILRSQKVAGRVVDFLTR